jgi:hypothetical protein
MGAPEVIIGRRTRKNNHNVYILGAGFSVDAGLPTISNFLNQMRDAADWLANEHRDDERAAVERVLEFRHSAAAAGYRVNIDLDNIEDLFSLAAARPGESMSRDMQESRKEIVDGAMDILLRFCTCNGVNTIRRSSPLSINWPTIIFSDAKSSLDRSPEGARVLRPIVGGLATTTRNTILLWDRPCSR